MASKIHIVNCELFQEDVKHWLLADQSECCYTNINFWLTMIPNAHLIQRKKYDSLYQNNI